MPRVSVVIATYNRAAFVTETVANVLAQADFGGELEVIVVDDGSTDETQAALRPLSGSIVYERIAHSGRPAVPRNVGIERSSGELIAFQDDDDLWAVDKLSGQVSSFREDPGIAMSYGNAEFVDRDGASTGALFVSPELAHSGMVAAELLVRNFVPAQTPVVPRRLLDELGGFDEHRALRGIEDYELWLRIATRGPLRYEGRVLAYVRRHGNNLGAAADDDVRGRFIAAHRAFLRAAPEDLRPLVRRRLTEGYLDRASIRRRRRSPSFILSTIAGAYHRVRLSVGT